MLPDPGTDPWFATDLSVSLEVIIFLPCSTVRWPWKKEQVLSWAKLYVSRHLPLELRKVDTGTNSCLIDVQNF
jgi:hypothetical protein